LTGCGNEAIAFYAQRDLLGQDVGSVSRLWELPEARRILARQQPDGSWCYPGGKPHIRSRAGYDQLEAFRQFGILVQEFGFTRNHPAIERAADFLLSSQTPEGDLRGIYGNQYATTYVGAIVALLVEAGYAGDPRIEAAFRWLLSIRQDDGGWAIPLRTVGIPFSEFTDARRHPDPVEPDRSKASSHLVTGMALRAFAAHPIRRDSQDARVAGELLAARLYKRDFYGDRGDAGYWERVSFPFWFTDVVSSLDSLSRLGFDPAMPTIRSALERLKAVQRQDATFALKLVRGKDPDLPWWVCLACCRSLKRWHCLPGVEDLRVRSSPLRQAPAATGMARKASQAMSPKPKPGSISR